MTMDRIKLLKNLLIMAAVDGSFTEEEIRFLSDRAEAWGIPDHEFAKAIDHVLSEGPALTIPDTKDARIELLQDLVRMIGSDGEMADTEKQLFAAAAAAMNISGDELDRIIDNVLDKQS